LIYHFTNLAGKLQEEKLGISLKQATSPSSQGELAQHDR